MEIIGIYKIGDIVQTGCPPVGRRHDGVGRIKSVGICTAEIGFRPDQPNHTTTVSLGIMYQVGSRRFLEEQLTPVRKNKCN